MISAVLFDLDGTLADTAPDLAGALNRQLQRRSRPPVPYHLLRPHASSGARGLIKQGFGMDADHPEYIPLRDEFLELYEQFLVVETVLFPDVDVLLRAIEDAGRAWGIVTNKASRFTLPLVERIGLSPRAGCVVCGDTTPHAKPHPAPLLEAARRLDVAPEACLYVGDDERDIRAARAAGMGAIAAAYGYLGTALGPHHWGADAVIQNPIDLLKLLDVRPSTVQ
jgi:2-phosphoglycolate phosphatase